ncbi:MAG: alpha/beta hydrolase [Spongiibacter sp.]
MSAESRASDAQIEQVIARVQQVYSTWRRDTSAQQMREDWDRLFWRDTQPAQYRDDTLAGVAVRWIDTPDCDPSRLLMYFHGGGFKMGSVVSHHDLMVRLSAAAGCRVVGVNYRLFPEHGFPAPVDDALAVYRQLLAEGYHAGQIAVAGDSAGGGVAASLLVALGQAEAPQPAAAVLLSPWLDMTLSGDSYESRASADPIHQRFMLDALANQYLGKEGDRRNPLASPLFAELAGLPPLLLQVGDREVGLDDSVAFAERAQQAGVEVALSVWDRMIHVFQQFAEDLPEARQAINDIGHFLQDHWQSPARARADLDVE